MPKKRLTRSQRQQLEEPDKFIAFTSKIIGFLAKHKIVLLWGVSIIIIIIGAIFSFYYYSDRAESNASVMLAKSLAKYESFKSEKGIIRAYKEVSDEFIQIFENSWAQDNKKLARVMYANICYNAGEFDKAIELYNKAIFHFENNSFIKNLLLTSIAYSYEGKKDYNSTIKYLETIISVSDYANKDETLFNLGRLYALMKNKEKSIEAFNKIIFDYKNSRYLELAQEKIFNNF